MLLIEWYARTDRWELMTQRKSWIFSHGSAHSIIHYILKYPKLCARWFPRLLRDENKSTSLEDCREHLQRYEVEKEDFLHGIVSADESWVHHYEPESNAASMSRRHSTTPQVKTCRRQPAAGKVMLTLFWNAEGPILIHYTPRSVAVNSENYSELLSTHLKPSIFSKRKGSVRNVLSCCKTMLNIMWQREHYKPYTNWTSKSSNIRPTIPICHRVTFMFLDH
jgi:hypothetical protein